jgi:hypothetical protein
MIKPRALACETRNPQLPANEIDPVQSSPAWIEPEDSNTEQISTIDCFGKNAPPNKDETLTSVSGDERRDTLHEFQSNVASPVFDPAEIAGSIQIADLARITRCHDGFIGTKVMHPLPTKLDGISVRGSTRSWFRHLSHMSRVHPSPDSRSSLSRLPRRPDPVGRES